jgi:tetratricopeptide (TPR) repeat protein
MPSASAIQQLLAKATSLYHSGDYRQAIEVWQEILQADPNNQPAREGIRMASLLLEEAQFQAGDPAAAASDPGAETPDVIAKVREGIEKVRTLLAASRHLEAIEVCRSLLAMAPRSAAVHEIVDAAREAYEAQPFIQEHLEIARQLFIQERYDEALAECHKIFFLNDNHADARKLEAKIRALKNKLAGPAAQEAPEAEPAGERPATPGVESRPEPGPLRTAPDPSTTLPGAPSIDFGDSVDLPLEGEPALFGSEATHPPEEQPTGPSGEPQAHPAGEETLNQAWEQELADLTLEPPAAAPEPELSAPAEPPAPEEPIPLTDLSEPMAFPAAARDPVPAPEAPEPSPLGELDQELASIPEYVPEHRRGRSPRPAPEPARSEPEPEEGEDTGIDPEREEPIPRHAPSRRGGRTSSPLRWILPLAFLLILGGAGWYFLLGSSSSGSRQDPPPPPQERPRRAGAATPGGAGGGDRPNVGLSSTGNRPAEAGVGGGILPAPQPRPRPQVLALTPEEAVREVAVKMREGQSLLDRGRFVEAAQAYSRVLALDPANLEAKEKLDLAKGKVLEQTRLEEDLQAAKNFFMDRDYESALRKFYRLPKDRNLGEIDLFVRNAWYNWAVMSLKGGNCTEAQQRLQEALTIDPGDADATKQMEVAERYRDRPKDRVFYAYVERLTYRTLNQR